MQGSRWRAIRAKKICILRKKITLKLHKYKYIWFLLQKEDLTRAEAQIISQNDNEENKENNPSETAVLSATVNRLNIDLQECRQIITKKDSICKC
jgi:hypothetical protein